MLAEVIAWFKRDASDWARGKTWWVRAPLLFWLVSLFLKHLSDPFYRSLLLGNFNFLMHEAGHYVVFAWFGEFVSILGGSVFEFLAPILAMIAFLRQREYFAVAFCFGWLSTALFAVAAYISDAQEQTIPLAFQGTIHDWYLLLTRMGILALDDVIGAVVRAAAILAMLLGLSFGSWLLWRMAVAD